MGVDGQRHASVAFTPRKDPVPIVQEDGWALETVWIRAENLAPTGIRSSDLPASSESLYRLRHPDILCNPLNNERNKSYAVRTAE